MSNDSPDLEKDMAKDATVISYLSDREIAKEFYAAMCNMRWKKIDELPEDERIINKLKGIDPSVWSCSWRHAGGIIADIRTANYNLSEDYMDFYCSSNEGFVSERVEKCFNVELRRVPGLIPRPSRA